jgi:hypothetical protein
MNFRQWLYAGLGAFVVAAWATLDTRPTAPRAPGLASVPPSALLAPGGLPADASRPVLEAAVKDPFAAVAPAPTPVVATIKPHTAPPTTPQIAAPPPEPVAPPLNLRFAGRMTGPDGRLAVFAIAGNDAVTLTPGLVLPDGYRVDRITPEAVELTYAPLNTRARLDLPPAPAHETR